ncbi:Atrial natriuretic peptide receptor 3 [Collichthys lucidus]|uniref:Atrial natriuretic peptide receptor 3 n=1 Tax=Collichthys lucidus TaxID=240159 RepID=A0A4U5UTK5_COLLU|nr:Atrial natriuretic peptide receptor 3 [Collichthys lucidus]
MTNTITEDIDVLAFLPQNNSYLFSRARVEPAILYAQQRLETGGGQYSGFRFNIKFENSDCVNDAMFKLLDRSCGHKPDLILGPACEYEAAAVVRLASYWNIPVISAGALAAGFSNKNTEYSHLTRIAPSYVKMAETFTAMFEHFTWRSALLILHRVAEADTEERTDDGHLCFYLSSLHPHTETETYITSCVLSRAVVIMCMEADKIREIMLAAHRRRLTNGNYMFFNVELFNATSYGNGSWKRGDKYDNDARQAYASLNTVTLLRTVKPEFENFSMEMKESVKRAGFHDCKDCGSVNMFVEGFHDAMLLYAIALHEAIKNGYTKKNGTQITSRMWNRTFEGIAGQVSMDVNGDRNGDFSLMAMTDVETGTYEVVANYFGANGTFQLLPAFSADHFTLKGRYKVHAEKPDKSCK